MMHAIKFGLIFIFGVLLISCSGPKPAEPLPPPGIIPQPQFMEIGKGVFPLNASVTIFSESVFSPASEFLIDYIRSGTGFEIKSVANEDASIRILTDNGIEDDGYSLDISEKEIIIKANSSTGAFYAIQSLRQILPPQLEQPGDWANKSIDLPVLSIKDAPAYAYRGMHLDVARHFFPKEFIKKYISYLAMLKMNYFHWHLTEDQGWRIAIDQFPRLTTHAAYRDETLVGHYNDTPQSFDKQRYGGYYSKEDVREIVAFAKEHHITIIPEIEMPGHAQAAISAYPELGCTGEQIPVATKWGVFEDIYCPNQKTFAFLKGVLSEVMELFPGEYIHIGGDEAPKTRWKQCAHCQQLIADLGLKDEHELQSWFIKEIETFVNSHGKKIIGWDEILEGGLAPNATVMSWRGTQGGIEAARSGHNVIMTPTSHAYFDYYQSEAPNEPLAIGGFLPLEKVYSFNPIPGELTPEESKYIMGAQGNVWTEYMKTEKQVEYMIFPRILAMSEVVWSGPSANPEADYPEFVNRVEGFHERLKALDVNYANHLYTIKGKVIKKNDSVFYELSTPTSGKQIKYSINTDAPLYEYTTPILLQDNGTLSTNYKIRANVLKKDSVLAKGFTQEIKIHKGVKGTIDINVEPHPSYGAGGKEALINGVSGSDARYGDSEWLGFWGDDLEIEIDLGEFMEVTELTTRFYHAPGQWIYAPKKVYVVAELLNGNRLNSVSDSFSEGNGTTREYSLDLSLNLKKFGSEGQIRKLILTIPNYGTIPQGKQGAGNKAWTFIDEIIIE